MGRWTQYDEDEYRLPQGMTRIGYDADSGRYLFQDAAGVVYQGAEGAQFSQMTPVGESEHPVPGRSRLSVEDVEAAPVGGRADGYQPLATDSNIAALKHRIADSPYRPLFPFFLIVGVALLLIWRLVLAPGIAYREPTCAGNGTAYWVQPGDSCWEIARAHGCAFEAFLGANAGVDCETLMPGTTVCLPAPAPAPAPTGGS